MRQSERVVAEHDVEVEYHQFNPTRAMRRAMALAGVLSWPLVLPLALLARTSDFVFHSLSQLLALIPMLPGMVARYEFYRFTLRRCGRNVNIGFGTVLLCRDIAIGDHVLVGMYCSIHHCDIGSYVLIADGCRLLSGSHYHGFERTDRPMALQGGRLRRIRLEDDCWIGANATVMHDVGTGSIVGAGSVVSQPVEPWTIVAGSGARVVRHRKAPEAAVVGLVLTGVTMACGATEKPFGGSADGPGHTPVLLVHGSGLGPESWPPLIERLHRAGYPASHVEAIRLEPDDGDNVRAAEHFIAPAVEALLHRTGHGAGSGGRVDLVSHSMGALSARWYAARLRPDRVRTWISLAGANHGTDVLCHFPGEGNAQLCPAFADSGQSDRPAKVQLALNGSPDARCDETPYGLGRDLSGLETVPADPRRNILYLTVRIEPDAWIEPSTSALLDGAGGLPIPFDDDLPVIATAPGNYLVTTDVGHDSLPKHPAVGRLVVAMLSARDGIDPFAAPRSTGRPQ